LEKIGLTREEANKFIVKESLDEVSYFDGHDIIEMSLVFDNENMALVDFELALSDEFPSRYSIDSVEKLKKEKAVLGHRIDLLKRGKFPPVDG